MNCHYVYLIKDCKTDDIVYIGKGKLERAYRQIFNINGKERMEEFYSKGGSPTSLLVFFAERLTDTEARIVERELINKYKSEGLFLMNKMIYSPHTKTDEWREKIRRSNVGKHNHFSKNNPNAKPCVFIPKDKEYHTLKELCESEDLPYSSVKTSLWGAKNGKKSKYKSLIKFIKNVTTQV